MGPAVGRGWVGQDARIRVIAARSAAVTHTPYVAFTATCRAT
jgi:hypothetical protein